MQRDFNSLFWETWGVKQKVYTYEDIFRIKNSFTESWKKVLYKFKNYVNIRTNSYIEILSKEPNDFYLLFNNLFYEVENDKSIELIKELNNITFTYRFLDILNIVDHDKVRKILSFQIAYIIEKISHLNVDISIFQEALKENSFKPYLDNYSKRKMKNQNGIAHDLHTTFIDKLNVLKEKYDTSIKDINNERVFINDISNWRKGELPEFFKILIINITFYSNVEKQEQRSQLILMLVLRALLHIKRENNIEKNIENQFLDELSNYRLMIEKKLKEKDEEGLEVLKLEHCIDFEKMLPAFNGKDFDLNILEKYVAPFCKDLKNLENFHIENDAKNKMLGFISKNIKWHY